ncbi:MAG: TauD/TfdA family dioxygenase [Burkholderiales bacterium]|nr:TauD/TfdA family dioxygenase [Burkholderiales bacterium]
MIPAASPFHPDNAVAYRAWREAKLAAYPERAADLVVEIGNPAALSRGEREAIRARCRTANMAIYAARRARTGKDGLRALGSQLGLVRLDRNVLADEDGISRLAASDAPAKGDYIPYTNRPIKWHTDGYYNPPARQIRGVILHCAERAAAGGGNALLDHELAYLRLRDADPEHVRALAEPDAMTIPPRMDDACVARPAETGPVFSVDPQSGALHMRYTARTRSIAWKRSPRTLAAVRALADLLRDPATPVFRIRLESGMGIVCNNVLHDRAGFRDTPACRRLVYRARYYDRVDVDE